MLVGCLFSHQPQLGLWKRRWDLENVSAAVEFPPPFPYTVTIIRFFIVGVPIKSCR